MQADLDDVSLSINRFIQSELTDTKEFCKVSKFCINNACFLVAALNKSEEVEDSTTITNVFNNTSIPVLGYFEFNNQQYAIIYTPEPSEKNDPLLTKLLTERELQISTLVALGWTNKQVAHQLQISEWTVSAHLRRIFIKLNVDSRAAMVYKCASLINQRI